MPLRLTITPVIKLVIMLAILSAVLVAAAPALAQPYAQTRVVQFAPLDAVPPADLRFGLAHPTRAYVHGVFGEDFELTALTGPDGTTLYTPPPGKVIEDRSVRIFDLDDNGAPEILLVEANSRQGANLVLIALAPTDDSSVWDIDSIARGPAIGRGFRWMNPLDGSVDVNGDGVAELAVMITPHIGGPVLVHTWQGDQLSPIRRIDVPGLSNHRYGDLDQSGSRLFRDADGQILIELRQRQDWTKTTRLPVQ